MCLLINDNQISLERDYLNSYLKTKLSDCILYSEDGAEFEIHKELLSQTKFMREILSSAKGRRISKAFFFELHCPKNEQNIRQNTAL